MALLVWLLMVIPRMSHAVQNDTDHLVYDWFPDYQPGFEYHACLREDSCKISGRNRNYREAATCTLKRVKDIKLARQFYQISSRSDRTITEPVDILGIIPHLDQTLQSIKYHTALDVMDSRWLTLWSTFKDVSKKIGSDMMGELRNISFRSSKSYGRTFAVYKKYLKKSNEPQYFSNPSLYNTFTDFVEKDRWKSDEMFVQQRLAGPCPFLLKKVTVKGEVGMSWSTLVKHLNPTYDFSAALNDAIPTESYRNIFEAVEKGRIYVLYHEENNDVFNEDRYDGSRRMMLRVTSPIALFVNTKNGELKVIAIQWDYYPDSSVLSPKSYEIHWALAKAMVNVADSNYCQNVWHLSHLHLSSSVYCNIFTRHLSKLHPLHYVMRHHCEGTVPYNAMLYHSLSNKGKGESKRFPSIGRNGVLALVRKGYERYKYGILAYDQHMKAQGLETKDIKYYPFRDDGKVMWNEVGMFAREFVNIYYRTDVEVVDDNELQGLANEVSKDGKQQPYGGRGKITGFPSSFTSKDELATFVRRFIWHIIMHASMNYAVEPWKTFSPIRATKLYNDRRTYRMLSMEYAYPRLLEQKVAATDWLMMGNFRMNRLMDHYDKLKDPKLNELVAKYHHRLQSCTQDVLEIRNAERKAKGQMGFQYFEPKWLTNSIHA